MTHDEDMKRCFCSPSYVCSRCIVAKRKTESAAAPHTAAPAAEPRFPMTYCSQCGSEQGPGNEGVSSCGDHRKIRAAPAADRAVSEKERAELVTAFRRTGLTAAEAVEAAKATQALTTAPPADRAELAAETALEAMVMSRAENGFPMTIGEACDVVREMHRSRLDALARSTDAPSDEWTLIAPDGMRFSGASPLRAASAAARHGIQTDPVKAKHFHDAIASLQAENDAENARLLAEHGTLNCPACGGSGHIGDVATSPAPATSTPCASGEALPLVSCEDAGKAAATTGSDPFAFLRGAEWYRAQAIAATQAPAVPATPTHRHIARGTLYTELGRGTLQTAVPLTDMMELVAYVGENGQWWFRAPSEFDDDERFAIIDPTRTPTASNTEDAQSMGAVSALPPEIAAIVERLHTQDNRITDNPLFAVQQKRQVCGLDRDYADYFAWVQDSEEVRDAEEIAALEAAFEAGTDTPGARRVGVVDRWEFVTGCLTEQGCKDFIACNGHNLHEPRIYAYGSYRNAEFIALRKWLMSLRAAPSTRADNQTTTEKD